MANSARMRIAAAHAADIAGGAEKSPGERAARNIKPKTTTRKSTTEMTRSISAAYTREPRPATVYERTTSSGVSTSTVCERGCRMMYLIANEGEPHEHGRARTGNVGRRVL